MTTFERAERTICLAFTIGLLSSNAVHPQPTPMGESFQVNTTTSGDQADADATSAGNTFLVVWQDPVGVRGQRIGVTGGQVGPEFSVPFTDPYPQRQPRVAGQGDGTFMVQWLSSVADGNDSLPAVRARMFDVQATPLHDPFVARAAAVSFFDSVSISSQDLAATEVPGRFVTASSEIGFYGFYGYGSGHNVRFDSDGSNLVTATTESGFEAVFDSRVQTGPPNTGSFQVWTSSSYVYLEGVYGRRLASNGVPVGSQITVRASDGYGTGSAPKPDAALADDGSLIVVWNEFQDIRMRRFGADNLPLSDATVLNEHVSGTQTNVRIGRGGDGTYLVVWESTTAPAIDTDQSGRSVRGRQLSSVGVPVGSEFQVNSLTQGSQQAPVVTTSGDGASFLVVWESATSDGDNSGQSIRAQRYATSLVTFFDGFESGDTSAWSQVVPPP